MANFFVRYWKTLAITSVSITSFYLFSHYDYSQINTHLLSVLTIQAAEYEKRNARKALSKNSKIQRRKDIDDDNDDEENVKDDLNRTDKSVTNIYERRFHDFASIEYNGEIYMTPMDFLESVVAERPRPRIGRRRLTDDIVNAILYSTPSKHRGSERFFRNLEDAGLISCAEYLFLWVILTKPSTQFEIAFSVFDTDGNKLVDKHEFLMFEKVVCDKCRIRHQSKKHSSSKSNLTQNLNNYFNSDNSQQTNTTLLRHFFGKHGHDTLKYTEFKRFMENLQMEILEIEFNEYSHGFKTISDLSFTEILLRYTNFDHDTKKFIFEKVKKHSDQRNTITFEQFKQFSTFLNNLEDFGIVMYFHKLSNKPISQAEFQRAVKISMGFELEYHIIALIFRIFDIDEDQYLSYDEFMPVMKDRLARIFHTHNDSNVSNSKFDQFKRCVRKRAKDNPIIALN
ncbi:unnamed protein product [Rotaria sordida]|uniref:EF-hand domain-containing protein n=1 Tax=Rotaria sordida TaxID=392033 RepID=A0A813QI76_9BILA|nr:unnamed protein product [Rotaria sordida]